MKAITSILLVLLVAICLPFCVNATHLRAADIIVEKVNCTGLTYKVTLRVYVNTTSNTRVGGFWPDDGNITFGDGTMVLVPEILATFRPDLGTNIGIATAEFFHTYAREGLYRINYFERDRSGGVVNIPGAHDVAYSTFVEIRALANSCNSFPRLTVAPLDRSCKGATFFHNPGAEDADGDSLSYELTVPSRSATELVIGYQAPDSRTFYTNWDTGNEEGTGPPSFTINPETGLITWDAPGMQGEYNIAFKVLEWRKDPVTEVYSLFSVTIRDMQIVVEDCPNSRPDVIVPANICIEAGKVLKAKFTGTDPDNDPVKIEVVSSILTGGPESFPATVDPVMTTFVSQPAEVNFEWKTNCIHVRDQNYQVIIKITDNPAMGARLVTFKTMNIKVIAPAPVWKEVVPDLVNRTARLSWEPYACGNAEKIEIWRKVGSSPITAGVCVSGLSRYRGYQLIATVGADATAFEDTNNGRKLSVAAQYCYRLVASFAAPGGGKSYVSTEFCLEPILADAPVITHVTVQKTDPAGVVRIKWLKPLDIDKTQYPEPYQYEVFRGNGFDNTGVTNISGRLTGIDKDEQFFDDVNANTSALVYSYTIVLYSRTRDVNQYNAIDTSATASTVRLTATPGEKQIRLEWEAEVPWSNVVDEDPWHYIYRGTNEIPEESLVLIDSVDVSEAGFEFIDTGKFQNTPLRDDRSYCYSIITKGTYGNSRIPLLLNRSQMVCVYPESNLLPCQPVLTVDQTNCDNFISASCLDERYFNHLTWTVPQQDGCRSDVVAYNVYFASAPGEVMALLSENITASEFKDENLTSFARCYAVQAVDTRGQLSLVSETQCNENCPAFELPNVFTPNDDGCNDLFSAMNGADFSNQDCPPVDPGKCPRFVKQVRLKVVNRWGRIVYEYRSDAQHSVLINWDGKDVNGNLLEPGVYFYTADVEFDVMDARQARKRLKGSIHLLR